jgi:hypothetical protein
MERAIEENQLKNITSVYQYPLTRLSLSSFAQMIAECYVPTLLLSGTSAVEQAVYNTAVVYPEATIVILEKTIRPSTLRNVIDWLRVFVRFVIGATAIEVLNSSRGIADGTL